MKWKFLPAAEVFADYQEQWDCLNQSIDGHILLDSTFWTSLIQFFSTPETLLGISESPEYPGMVLVEKVNQGMWSTFQPPQAPIGPILLGNSNNVVAQIRSMLSSLPGFAFSLAVMQQDPKFGFFHSVVEHHAVEKKDYVKTARIGADGDFETYWSSRGNDLKSSVRKRLRRLEREGVEVSLGVDYEPGAVERCIQQYGKLEESGWKGAKGTAVSSDNVQGKFYASMLKQACQKNEGVIYSLCFNDKTVAQKICLRRNEMMIFLKMAYDEEYRRLAPGYLLQYEMLKRIFADPTVKYIETYGRVNEGWTDKWTDNFRTMYHLNFYRYSGAKVAKRFLSGIRTSYAKTDENNSSTVTQETPSTLNGLDTHGHGTNVADPIDHTHGNRKRKKHLGGQSWQMLVARDGFPRYQEMWDELNQGVDNHVLLDSKFVAPLVQYFAGSETVLAIAKNSEYPGMVLVEPNRLGFWRTFQPSQAPVGLILLGSSDHLERQIHRLMATLPGLALGLSVTQQDPDYSVFSRSQLSDTQECV